MSKTIHVICNSHMDPIWQWRLREGRSTWLNTCRTVVRMMQKYPFLKFSRSSSACYRWIEACAPALFRQIRRLVDAGRWEPVGGWVEQSDVIVASGESLLRQAEYAKRYFREKFGKEVRTAYCVDSFGQNIGLPKILKASGFDYYAWMRPQQHEKKMPFIFRWQADDGRSDILCFRIRHAYCTFPELADFNALKEWFEKAIAESPCPNFFFGLGDHGGGIYEKQLQWLLKLGEDYNLVFSTVEEYFHELEKHTWPVVTGEHTHHAPGCYAAMHDVKQWMAQAENALVKAEKIILQSHARDMRQDAKRLDAAWEELLFNGFHDVFSGTCIKEAYDIDVRDSIGLARKTAVDIIEKNLCRLGATVRTNFMAEGGIIIWNSLQHKKLCNIQLDTFTDPNKIAVFNALKDESGRVIPLQWIRAAVPGLQDGARKWWGRAAVVDELPASGLRAYAYARTDKVFPAMGFARQKALLKKLRFEVVDDPYDTWAHAARSLGKTIGTAAFLGAEAMEDGPNVSRLRCRYTWQGSPLQLDLFAWRGHEAVQAVLTGEWNHPRKALKLCLQTGCRKGDILSGQALASIARQPDDCEQPFQNYVAAGGCGFLASDLHSYDSIGSQTLRLTVNRPVYYSEHTPYKIHGDEGLCDTGAIERGFWLFTQGPQTAAELEMMAQAVLTGAEHLEITAAADGRALAYDTWEVTPANVMVASQHLTAEGAIRFHLHNPTEKAVSAVIRRNGAAVLRKRLAPHALELVDIE